MKFLVALGLSSFLLGATACDVERGDAGTPERLSIVDTVLSELGGLPTADLSRGQRWRMVSSVGAGLPPSNFEAQALPDPTSRGAVLLQTYCQRCHGVPAPQMHAAAEWPILVRRMVMRARTLQERMGGPATEQMLGEILMAGMASADVPSTENVDSLVAYLQAHSLPTAELATIRADPEAAAFAEQCSQCHETPSPAAHTAAEWEGVVARMRANTALMDVPPIPHQAAQEILAWLQKKAGG